MEHCAQPEHVHAWHDDAAARRCINLMDQVVAELREFCDPYRAEQAAQMVAKGVTAFDKAPALVHKEK